MRPRGEIRQALSRAAAALLQERPIVTYKDLATAAMVGYQAARSTIKEMVRAGELEPAEATVQVPGSRRPLQAYRLGCRRPESRTRDLFAFPFQAHQN